MYTIRLIRFILLSDCSFGWAQGREIEGRTTGGQGEALLRSLFPLSP